MKLAEASFEEISTSVEMGDPHDIESGYEQLCGLLKKLDLSIEKAKDQMLETEQTLSQILEWSNGEKTKLKKFRDLKSKLKESLAKIQVDRDEQSLKKEIEKQRAINEENERARRREKEEMEELEVGNRERSQERIAGEHFASNCYSECETSKVYNYSIHRRLQRLDMVLESIFGRSRWVEHIRN